MRQQAGSRRSRSILLVLLPAAVLVFGGCQAIFTYSPVSGLQRLPSSMTPGQRLTYAQDALASGDTAAMKSAYDAIKNDTSAAAEYTTAQLGIELSGVPALLVKVAGDPSTLTAQLDTINAFITDNNLDPNYMVAAAAQLAAAQSSGVTLSDMDMAMGAMGIMLGGAQVLNGNWDFTGLGTSGSPAQAAAIAFLAPAVADVASLPSGDPMKDFINKLNTYISSPSL
jgi:hypothetical protein